jgi:hypothetical protein
MPVENAKSKFSIRQARGLIDDLFVYKPAVYWADFLLTTAVAYCFAALYLGAPALSMAQLVGLIVAGFALFRAGSYIHEITHMRHG